MKTKVCNWLYKITVALSIVITVGCVLAMAVAFFCGMAVS